MPSESLHIADYPHVRSFILTTSAIHLTTMVPACLLGLTQAKVLLNSLIHLEVASGPQVLFASLSWSLSVYKALPSAKVKSNSHHPAKINFKC